MYTHLQLRDSTRPPVTLTTLARMKEEGEKIACLTCYDASFAALVDEADTDVVLVGDSLGMVIQGHDTTVPVTMDHVVYHCRAVARGLNRPFLMADLPFMSYPSKEQALATQVDTDVEVGPAPSASAVASGRAALDGDRYVEAAPTLPKVGRGQIHDDAVFTHVNADLREGALDPYSALAHGCFREPNELERSYAAGSLDLDPDRV